MKKPKLSLGAGGVKGLFVQHVEKIVFGVAMLLVIVFVFLGYRLDSKIADNTPDKLRSLATTAVSNVERDTSAEVKVTRTPREGKGGQYFARVQGIDPLDPLVYAIKPWNQPMGSPNSKREDPEVFAPIKLETAALTGAICLRAEEGDESLLAKLENAPAPEKKKEKSKDKSRKKGGAAGMMGPGMYGEEGGAGAGLMGPGMYGDDDRDKGDKKKKDDRPRGAERRYPENKVCGYRPFGSGAGSYGSSSGMMPGGMPGMGTPGVGMPGMGTPGVGMPSMGTPGVGTPSMGTPGVGMPGMGTPGAGGVGMPGAGAGIPGMPGGGPMGGTGSTVTAAGQPIAASGDVIIVKALVPYRKQADEYKRVLGDALGYDPMRDQPRIVFFQAQRVDVTDDPQKEVQEADWQLVMTPKTAQTKAKEQRWHGIMPEVADYNYVDTNATMPVPPLMLRCMDKAMLHSDVPRSRTVATMATTGSDEGEKKDASEGNQEDAEGGLDLPGGLPGGGAEGGGFLGGAPGNRGSGYPGMMGGYPGSGYPSMPGGGYSGMGGMMPPGSGPGAGLGGYGGYGGSSYAAAELVQYKLIRFCDTDVEPGKVYRYRVRVFLEDPNNPNTDPLNAVVNVPPRRRSLSMKVIERLNKQDSGEAAKKSYYVVSPWSETTEPASLPSTSRLFAGEVEPARMAVGAEGSLVQQSEAYGNLIPVVWNDELAIDVSTETRGFRGSVLNFTRKQFDVLDPVSLVIKLLRSYDFQNQYMVLDIRGGEDLPGDRKELVTSPGEYALVDDTGNFRVFSELDDYKEYARYSFADEIVSASAASGGMMPGSGYPGVGAPGIPGAGGMPGMPGAAGSGGGGGGGKRGRR